MMRTILLLTGIVLAGCGDLVHDNAYDPKNPRAEASQIAVAENFVIRYTNLNTTPSVVWNSQSALYDLKAEYGDRLIILEYHMAPWHETNRDSLAKADDTLRYNNEYKPASVSRGFPHVFFNGKHLWIQGASSEEVARSRYKTILDTLTLKKVKLYCQPDVIRSGNTLQIDAKIVRFGDSDISNLEVEYMIVQSLGDSLRYTVRRHLTKETVTTILAGEIYEMPQKTWDMPAGLNVDDLSVVVLIKDGASKRILQAAAATL